MAHTLYPEPNRQPGAPVVHTDLPAEPLDVMFRYNNAGLDFGVAIARSAGLLGLALAAIGLFGVLLYSVSGRIRESGPGGARRSAPQCPLDRPAPVRRACRRRPSIGLALAVFVFVLRRFFLTPEIRAGDSANFAGVVAILFRVAVAATIGPSLRALEMDPIRLCAANKDARACLPALKRQEYN